MCDNMVIDNIYRPSANEADSSSVRVGPRKIVDLVRYLLIVQMIFLREV
jgi:hypothetical protein